VCELNMRMLRIQKRVIRSMIGASSRTSCRHLFKELNILTLPSLHILEVTCFVRKFCQSLELNSSVHIIINKGRWIFIYNHTKLIYTKRV